LASQEVAAHEKPLTFGGTIPEFSGIYLTLCKGMLYPYPADGTGVRIKTGGLHRLISKILSGP
jgi:hypothetical protein